MSTETLITKPNTVCKNASTESKTQPAVASAATHGAKPQTAGKIAAELAVPKPMAESVRLLLVELKSPDSAGRARAAGELGRMADAAAAPALIAALRDADADVGREAATSLGVLGNATAVEPLIAVVNNRDGYFHSVVRVAAIHSLGQLRDLRAVEPLLKAIKDPMAEASAEAIDALASLSDPRSLPALLEVVRNEHGFFLNTTRRAAILGLAKIGGEQAACEVGFVAANQWEDAGVRAAAIEAKSKRVIAIAGA